jgi:spore maturation protein CgeB
LKVLYGYPHYPSGAYLDVAAMHRVYLERLRAAGFDVEGFCLTLNPPAHALTWPELDRRWRRGDRQLLELYSRLEAALDGKDVLFNSVGMNLHPEFVAQVRAFTVFQCFDDPENSANLSRPAAHAYDLCLVGNVAEVKTYQSWGVANVEWIPLGLHPDVYDTALSYEQVLNGERDIELFMMMDRSNYPIRWDRLQKLAAAFPTAAFYGNGWPLGFLSPSEQISTMRRAKVGPNIHNSTGPINLRTYYLPANGVMQVCDNKSHLGTVYELGKEVVGFETIEECIDICRYYLAHDQERRQIAADGWKRAVTDYNEIAVFGRAVNIIRERIPETPRRALVPDVIGQQRRRTAHLRVLRPYWALTQYLNRKARSIVRAVRRLTS